MNLVFACQEDANVLKELAYYKCVVILSEWTQSDRLFLELTLTGTNEFGVLGPQRLVKHSQHMFVEARTGTMVVEVIV